MLQHKQAFHRELWQIALPVTLQCLLHSSFGVVDQIMVGQLGTVSVAAIGLASRFGMLYNVALNGIAAAAGIMIAQYVGQRNSRGISRSFLLNLLLAAGLAVAFAAGCMAFPRQVMSLYTTDPATKEVAAAYLRICALGLLPSAAIQLMAALLRCTGAARLPLYATGAAAVLNTFLNYALIFGRFGLPAMGANGAAWGSVLAQSGGCLLILVLGALHCRKQGLRMELALRMEKAAFRQYLAILLPALGCEVLWGLGENAYAAIYGRMGTAECAA
ncbi:MAG: MATE family efflux transporter, partial [Gemmiger sp.]